MLTIEVKRPNDKFSIPMLDRSDVLAGKLEGQRLDELGICTVIRDWQGAQDVIDFLLHAQNCFPNPHKSKFMNNEFKTPEDDTKRV